MNKARIVDPGLLDAWSLRVLGGEARHAAFHLRVDPLEGFAEALFERVGRGPAEFFRDEPVVGVAAANTERAWDVADA